MNDLFICSGWLFHAAYTLEASAWARATMFFSKQTHFPRALNVLVSNFPLEFRFHPTHNSFCKLASVELQLYRNQSCYDFSPHFHRQRLFPEPKEKNKIFLNPQPTGFSLLSRANADEWIEKLLARGRAPNCIAILNICIQDLPMCLWNGFCFLNYRFSLSVHPPWDVFLFTKRNKKTSDDLCLWGSKSLWLSIFLMWKIEKLLRVH